MPRTLVGASALDDLGALLDGLDGTSLVVIADQGVQATGYIDRVVGALRPRPITCACRRRGGADARLGRRSGAVVRSAGDAIVIGVGGGSALDIAKQAAVVAAGDSGVEPYLLCANPLARAPTDRGHSRRRRAPAPR